MTLSEFERRLKEINPKFSIRKRSKGDVAGVFLDNTYLVRVTQGELNLNGYSMNMYNMNKEFMGTRIAKRGRKTVVRLLEMRGVIPSLDARASLLWGIGKMCEHGECYSKATGVAVNEKVRKWACGRHNTDVLIGTV